ncbi:MAG TPA: hypothetical protein PLJ71_00260 [Candidatus Hydrogenedentes bacterium]|nr:hypothetical protein [Candidatus Hydrogenedentota bacterium]HQM47082.1 hypothetical protein [Candidatus Hydrogenedentota bacterium]
MKKLWVLLFAALGILVVVGIIAFVVADRKFAVLKSPEFSHSSYVTPDTRVQIAAWPGRGEDTLTALLEAAFPEDQRPSSWVVRRILPQEVAILIAPDVPQGSAAVTGFVNDQRLGPVIRDAVNSANISKSVPTVRWANEGMVLEKRGVLTLRGETRIDRLTQDLTGKTWAGYAVAGPLELEGGHAVEAVLDNRDGGAFAVLSAFRLLVGADGKNNPEFFVGMFANVASMRVFADFTGPQDVALTLRIDCRPDVEEDIPGSLQFFLDMGIAQGKKEVESKGAALNGASRLEGKSVVGEYTISGLDKLVRSSAGSSAS